MRKITETMADAQILFAFLADSPTENASDTAEFVLAMGSQDLHVPDTAARAFQEKRAEWLVCSGGLGKDTAALFSEPEAVLYWKRCRELGVPAERILIEPEAANSGENFCFSRVLLEKRGIFPRTGVIACKPYMARRAWATAQKQWPEVEWSVARQSISLPEYLEQGNDRTAVLDLLVGDLQRLRVYAGRFQVPVAVPDNVWKACERVAADGYDRFVIRGI